MTERSDETQVDSHEALVYVSPLVHGEEEKNQDRATWFVTRKIACVCDGVTSSPCSEQAAELAAACSSAIFNGPTQERLRMVCDLLLTQREEYQATSQVQGPTDTSPAMQQMLSQIIQEKKRSSFQTTMVAAQFHINESTTKVHMIKCGDSAFIAFSPKGEMLTSTIRDPVHMTSCGVTNVCLGTSKEMSFGPGNDILVRIEGELTDHASLARRAGIRKKHLSNWLVCSLVDHCPDPLTEQKLHVSVNRTLRLRQGDPLLIPKYLYGSELFSKDHQYRILSYSTAIRSPDSLLSSKRFENFSNRGSVTKVLPDHIREGGFDSFSDTYPCDTNFILCSDGFYGCFLNWAQMFGWLQTNRTNLMGNNNTPEIMKSLHQRLVNHGGDDDISFIWIYPKHENSMRE